MKNFLSSLRGAIVSTLVFAIVLCGLYPITVWAFGQLLFSDQANGSLITDQNGNIRGSRLLGQNFTGDAYFHPRPSSAGASGYDAASSSGSNLGPTSQKLADQIKECITAYRTENHLGADAEVPADAVTASGSGLDPHISLRNAELQTPRVAEARNLPPNQVLELIRSHADNRSLGVLGDPGVNVLELNLALDAIK